MPTDVHPQIQAILDTVAALNIPKMQTLTPEAARALFEGMATARRESYAPPPVADITNTSTGAGYGHVPIRIYRPNAETTAAIVFFHGGGHVIGSLDSYDTVTRTMARTCNVTVISVDYRMAPEHPFPAAPQDCFDATRWALANAETLNIDPAKITIAGDSAGGNLAAVTALMARDAGLSLAAQILIYPVTDYRGGTPSFTKYATGFGGLEAETVTWFMNHYLPDPATRDDWRASPDKANSHANLPPALVLLAECDVLHDEGAAYAALLRTAGNTVELQDFPGMIHGFFNYLGLADDTDKAHQTVADFLHKHLTS